MLVCDLRAAQPGPDGFHDTLEPTWAAVRAVANAAMIPGERGGKITFVAPASSEGDAFAAALRAALENMARTLSIEWARYGIRPVTILPGPAERRRRGRIPGRLSRVAGGRLLLGLRARARLRPMGRDSEYLAFMRMVLAGMRANAELGLEGERAAIEQRWPGSRVPRSPRCGTSRWTAATVRSVRASTTAVARGDPAGLVYIHGGGWALGSIDSWDPVVRDLAAASGAAMLAIDQRQAPEHPFPAALEDAHAATLWAAAHAQELGIDAARLGIGGRQLGRESGGRGGASPARRRRTAARRQLLVYGTYDLTTIPARPADPDGLVWPEDDRAELLARYLAGADAAQSPTPSPLLASDHAGLAPAIVVTAEHDRVRAQGSHATPSACATPAWRSRSSTARDWITPSWRGGASRAARGRRSPDRRRPGRGALGLRAPAANSRLIRSHRTDSSSRNPLIGSAGEAEAEAEAGTAEPSASASAPASGAVVSVRWRQSANCPISRFEMSAMIPGRPNCARRR